MLVLANVADAPVRVAPATFGGFDPDALDLIGAAVVDLSAGVELGGHGVLWLRVSAAGSSGRP